MPELEIGLVDDNGGFDQSFLQFNGKKKIYAEFFLI